MKKSAHILFASWLVLSGIAGSPTPCWANAAVTLKPDFETSRLTVKLSDLFNGVPSEIDRDIAQAPAPCKPAVYNEPVLDKLAAAYRLDWQSAPNADHVVITSACTKISGDMIRDAIVTKIKSDGNYKERNFEVTFDIHNLEVDLPVNQKPDFTLENFSYDPLNKQFRADLTASTSHGPYVMPLIGHIAVKRNVPILARRLEAGTTISAADLDWVQVPEEKVTADVITETDQLVGRELRRDTAEGDLLRSHDVMPARLVTRGSLVMMKIDTPYISVTAQGKSEQDGAAGDTIRITNTSSNRVVEGIVTGPGVVEIRTTRKIASAE